VALKVDDNFIKSVLLRVSSIKSIDKKSIFTISSTSKIEKIPYLTPVRKTNDFIISGCIIFNQQNLKKLINQIDGEIDIILVDSEKAIPLKVNSNSELENNSDLNGSKTISESCFNVVKKSKIFEFKPNDLTVDATWSFLSMRLKSISRNKISILGAGNIGSKLALKLVECGSEISIYRRDQSKSNLIINGLNLIKPKSINAKISSFSNPLDASFMSNVLIGTSNGTQIITKKIINNLCDACLIVDLGKNNLTKNAIKAAKIKSMEIYRVDVTPFLESYVYGLVKMHDIIESSYGKRDLGFCSIVSGGYFGDFGDFVVDSINNPKQVIGICEGDGLLKNNLTNEDRTKIQKLKKELNIES
jgi:hypothetical protein